ncbi:hypothetical protein [Bradyrhizobium ottawaense]|uniref:Uncharacterized protein n=1 Tax=Bradyrhizobium ottawaense TaxID=931866 RepID=A0ABY0QHF5_9BRAD|nr:hypothetical protein [Bradyrhizobium ottawaense]SDK43255.1 hypothetical protein SAMN05444163_8098 [Bradyrhizobium ottawaense]
MTAHKRIKVTDDLGNVAYIHRNQLGWTCTLANGIPASFFYAVGNVDETAFRFHLEDAADDDARLNVVKDHAGPRRKVEFFS